MIKHNSTDPYTDPFHNEYLDKYFYYSNGATLWFRGFLSLAIFQQKQWDELVVDGFDWYVQNGRLVREASDAILPASTQAPFFFRKFDNVDRRLVARGANHLEETVHPSVKERLQEIFLSPDVDIEEKDEGDPIDPPPLPGPCYDENGNQIICPTEN